MEQREAFIRLTDTVCTQTLANLLGLGRRSQNPTYWANTKSSTFDLYPFGTMASSFFLCGSLSFSFCSSSRFPPPLSPLRLSLKWREDWDFEWFVKRNCPNHLFINCTVRRSERPGMSSTVDPWCLTGKSCGRLISRRVPWPRHVHCSEAVHKNYEMK